VSENVAGTVHTGHLLSNKLPTHFRANDVICSLLLCATQTCCHTCGQCESTIICLILQQCRLYSMLIFWQLQL